jgi:hypothetical protein
MYSLDKMKAKSGKAEFKVVLGDGWGILGLRSSSIKYLVLVF